MSLPLVVEKFRGIDFVDASDEDAFQDLSLTLSEINDFEMEGEKFTNLRHNLSSHAAMLSYLLQGNAEVVYPPFRRTKFEVRNGYKEAVRRGANLQETEVFNLLFQFRGDYHGDGIALMCHGPTGEEWIMLCADDTIQRIAIESQRYRSVATQLTLLGKMDSDHQNELLENLRTLIPGSRCANSLMHEYGHVLQHRIWAGEGIKPYDASGLYDWFESIGYVENVAMRIPGFLAKEVPDILHLLKESFVEDYRIGLNLSSQNGIFELPNAHCFLGDFQIPELMVEGVSLVESVIRTKSAVKPASFKHSSYEPDRVALIDEYMAVKDFEPEKSRMTPADHQSLRDRVKAYQLHSVM